MAATIIDTIEIKVYTLMKSLFESYNREVGDESRMVELMPIAD